MISKDKQREISAANAIIQKPLRFDIESNGKKCKFVIHRPTLGHMQILSNLYLQLDIDEESLNKEPHLESMRVCSEKADIVAEIMSVATFKNPEDILDDEKIKERADFFKWNTFPEDFSQILLALLTFIDYENFMISIRLTKHFRQNMPKAKKQADRVE